MNRRELLKTAGLCLAAACLPKLEWGGEMRYGDLLAKLASGQQLSQSEAEMLRLFGNQQETIAGQVAGWTGNSGMISSGAIPFPFVAAHLVLDVSASGSQTMNSSETVLVWSTSADQAFSYNMDITSTGIGLTAVPPGAIVQVEATIHWDATSSGSRTVNIRSDAGLHGQFYLMGGAGANTQTINFTHVVRSGERAYWLTASQNAVGSLDILANSRFSVIRLR